MPSPKNVLVPLGLKTALSKTDAEIQKKIFEPGSDNPRAFGFGTTILIISNN